MRKSKPIRWQDHISRADLVERLRECAGKGMSYSEAAAAIGFGLNKDKVSGLATRNGINFGDGEPMPLRASRLRRKELDDLRRDRDAGIGVKSRGDEDLFRPVRFRILNDAPATGPIHARDLQPGDGRCRWPLWPHRFHKGDGPFNNAAGAPTRDEMMFCGERADAGKAYCAGCEAKAFERPVAPPGKKTRMENADGRRPGRQFGT